MSLVAFTENGRSFDPRISIHTDKDQLIFSNAAYKQFKLDQYKPGYVVMYFDTNEVDNGISKIYLKLLHRVEGEKERGAKAIRHRDTGGADITVLQFMRHFGLNKTIPVRASYEPIWDEKEGMLYIDVSKPIDISTPRKWKNDVSNKIVESIGNRDNSNTRSHADSVLNEELSVAKT